MARYRLGTEQALGQANFLTNPDITLLQALAIYLNVLQYTGETKTAWVLAGVLVRAAVSMKLHLDDSKFGNISPFDTQIRRRLWWQICLIDSKSDNSQLFAFKLSESMFETEKPTNTDDANLDPTMSQVPLHSQGWSDMSVFLLRCEIWTLSRQFQSIPDINQKREVFKRKENRIYETYLSHLDTTQPIQAFMGTNVRLFLTKLNLILLPKPHSTNNRQSHEPAQVHKIFSFCLAVIDYTFALQNEPRWSGWRWQIQSQQPPWNALRTVLGHLSTVPWEPRHHPALASARRSLESLPESSRNDPHYHPILVQLSMVENIAHQHHEDSASLTNVSEDGTWQEDWNLSSQIAQTSINEASVAVPSESLSGIPEYTGAEMDWQAWNDIAGDLEFWDMSNL
jgi:hypothetical protein